VSVHHNHDADDIAAWSAGIDAKENVRQGLIDLRNALLKADQPAWDYIVLLSHAIWWLAPSDPPKEPDNA